MSGLVAEPASVLETSMSLSKVTVAELTTGASVLPLTGLVATTRGGTSGKKMSISLDCVM